MNVTFLKENLPAVALAAPTQTMTAMPARRNHTASGTSNGKASPQSLWGERRGETK